MRKILGGSVLRILMLEGALTLCAGGLLTAQLTIPRPRLPGQKSKGPAEKKPSEKEILTGFTGTIRKVTPELISLDAEDTRIVNFKCSKITKYVFKGQEVQASVLRPGDEIHIEARQDDEGFFYAVNVSIEKQAPAPLEPVPAAEPVSAPQKPVDVAVEAPPERPSVLKLPPALTDPDDAGPPVLKRGKPPKRTAKAPAEIEPEAPTAAVVTEVAASGVPRAAARETAAVPAEESFINKVRETALNFSESLPNYLCLQMTTRYQSEGRPANWVPNDVVSAEVVYENGNESYRNIKINNKLVKKEMEELSGGWSRGEFGTTLIDLLSPATAADFHYRRDSTAAGLPAAVYDFQVQRPNSHWETRIGGQSIFPAYKGSVWIGQEEPACAAYRDARAQHFRTSSRSTRSSGWSITNSCASARRNSCCPCMRKTSPAARGTTRCSRNAIDFRNYRKFTSESQIMTTDSAISFDGADAEKTEVKKK